MREKYFSKVFKRKQQNPIMAKQKKLEIEEKKEETKGKIDIEKTIIELAKTGLTSEKIGLILKEKHGIKSVKKETGKRISKILKENNIFIDPDIKNLKEKIDNLTKHIEKNKHDYTTKRIFPIKSAKLKKLEKCRKK